MFQTIYRGLAIMTRGFASLGVFMLIVTMLATVVDVALRRTVNVAIIGMVDITQLLVMGAVFMAIPFAFFTESHIVIELVTDRLPRRSIAALKFAAALITIAFMAAVLRYGWVQAIQQHGYGDRSQTIGIPILLYWIPLLAGSALSIAAAGLIVLRQAIIAVSGEDPVR